jgi:hypothetical protein
MSRRASARWKRTAAPRSVRFCSRFCRERAIRHFAEQTVCRPVKGTPQIGQDGITGSVRTLLSESEGVEWGIR